MNVISCSSDSHFFRSSCSVVSSVMFLATTATLAAHPVRRIRFAHHATRIVVKGNLNRYSDRADFIIRVGARQRMRVEATSPIGFAAVRVISPTGGHENEDHDMSGARMEVNPTRAGDYRIIVTENRKGEPWKGNFYLKVAVH